MLPYARGIYTCPTFLRSVEESNNEVMIAKNAACFSVLKQQLEDGGSVWQFFKVYLTNWIFLHEILMIGGC